jgi:hypothetical protein
MDPHHTAPIEAIHSRYLRDLVSINSVYTNPPGIEDALRYCERGIAKRLSGFRIRHDDAGNLIANSDRFDPFRSMVLLSRTSTPSMRMPRRGNRADVRSAPWRRALTSSVAARTTARQAWRWC